MNKPLKPLILWLIVLAVGAMLIEILRASYARGEAELRWSRRLTKALYFLVVGSLIIFLVLLAIE